MVEDREVSSRQGVVAAQPPEAARVGARVLEQGGNAFDAAAAACLACCMLQPGSTDVGGYVFVGVVRDGKTGEITSVDANSVAPAGAREDMFGILPLGDDTEDLNAREYFCRVKDDANVFGPLAVGVPGTLAGIGTIWEKWGRLEWEDILAPFQRLLEDGFPYDVTAGQVKSLQEVIRRYPATAAHLLKDGKVPKPDDLWHRPDMEKTLARLATAGWRDMYEGELAGKIVSSVQGAGGLLSREDMASVAPRLTRTLITTYRDATVHAPILPNGALTCLEILNMLECFPPADGSAEYWHRLAEMLKLAWRDRLKYLADPDFVEVPVERLLSKEYAAGRVETIRQYPEHVDKLVASQTNSACHGTLHVSTADSEGNLVSATISQGGAFGSCFTVPDTGLILGHGMCRLDPRPGHANSIAPRKRPLNNTGTMLIETPERFIASGLPGGRRIISCAARMAQALIDRSLSPLEAAETARMHVEIAEPVEITRSAGEQVIAGLRERGHEVNDLNRIAGSAHLADYDKGTGAVRGGGAWAAGL